MVKIVIKNLRLKCIIGCNKEERDKKQDVIINLAIWTDFSNAPKFDDLENTVDYSVLNKKIADFVEASNFKLIETLADKIADKCLEEKRINKVKVRVEKLGTPKFAEGVEVEVIKHA